MSILWSESDTYLWQRNCDVSVVPADGPISEEITKNHDPSERMMVAAVVDDVNM